MQTASLLFTCFIHSLAVGRDSQWDYTIGGEKAYSVFNSSIVRVEGGRHSILESNPVSSIV